MGAIMLPYEVEPAEDPVIEEDHMPDLQNLSISEKVIYSNYFLMVTKYPRSISTISLNARQSA